MITKVFSQLSTGPYDATRTDQQEAAVQYTGATTPPLGRDLLNGNAYEWNCSPWRMLTTPVNTQNRPLPLRNNCFNPTPSYRPSICY